MIKQRKWPLRSYVVWTHPATGKTYKTSWIGQKRRKRTKEISNG